MSAYRVFYGLLCLAFLGSLLAALATAIYAIWGGDSRLFATALVSAGALWALVNVLEDDEP